MGRETGREDRGGGGERRRDGGEGEEEGTGKGRGQGVAGPPFANFWIRP